jgi:uncharacterized protein (TIGR02598 family)
MSQTPPSLRAARGFTLVEICLAMGVCTVALCGIFGLMSVALGNSKDTQRDAALTSVIRNLEADVRTFPAGANPATETRYFDLVGKPVEDGASGTYYRVTFSPAAKAAIASAFSIKDQDQAAKLQVLTARIAYPPPSYPQSTVVVLGSPGY